MSSENLKFKVYLSSFSTRSLEDLILEGACIPGSGRLVTPLWQRCQEDSQIGLLQEESQTKQPLGRLSGAYLKHSLDFIYFVMFISSYPFNLPKRRLHTHKCICIVIEGHNLTYCGPSQGVGLAVLDG